jgi:hypothetical protein
MSGKIDLGDGHMISFADWNPDLDLNPQLAHLSGQFPVRVTGIVTHKLPGDGDCEGAITFDSPIARAHFSGPFWTVESWDPLTLSPSLLCHCGDHGFIRDGRWVTA